MSVQVSNFNQRFGGFLFTKEMLVRSMRRILNQNNRGFKAVLPMKRFMNIQEALARINDLLEKNKRAVFSEIAASAFARADIIAHFLAVLELFKKQEIYILQDLPLGEIVIERMG
jgi:chromatin segregation and condensation protein Rec8/ScpA/Scc1 (kleisin family)